MAKKCKEVFDERAEARLKTPTRQFAATCLSPNLILDAIGCISPAAVSQKLENVTFPSPLLLASGKNPQNPIFRHFNETIEFRP